MNPFRYERASDAKSAVALLTREPGGVFLAGGTNLVDHLRLGVRQPDLLIDITHLPYDRIEPLPDGGVRIGALVRNSDLAADRTIRSRYPLLAQALLAAHALRLLPGHHQALQQADAGQRLLRAGGLSSRTGHPGDLACLHRHASLGHGRRPGCT
jgi:hypothetical protein